RPETIDKAEDRQMFKDTMEAINQPIIPSLVVTTIEDAVNFANQTGYPLIIRPAFTLGGTGGGIVNNETELREIGENGLYQSPIHQILVEKCISGWKEIEFEVIRDSAGNVITVCSMENLDPVGVHTGDSIVVAPAVSLAEKEFAMLRNAALDIVTALEVEGGCNCQFALDPETFEYAVIEVNPRVSRSSALASKATGYPIAKVATKIAIGYTLDEIQNDITGITYAACEPTIDYIVVKFPKWPFDKFVYANKTLGTQMKATGEVMSIGTSFEQAIMKAVRGAEIKLDSLNNPILKDKSDEEIRAQLSVCDDNRLFVLFEALKRGISVDEIHDVTKIDEWFLYKLGNLVNLENRLASETLTDELYLTAKKNGYPDKVIERISGQKVTNPRRAVYKMVDTCAAEFPAQTPYFYSTYDDQNEAEEFINNLNSDKKTVIVFGSGPIRIGQGVEFDYASVHCVWSLKEAGFDVVIVNNNPETVSTDFDTADRLYFEPLTPEDVMNIIQTEKPYGAVVAFGGQTAIKLTNFLDENGVKILGTSAESIDAAEDREKFDAVLEMHNIKRPKGLTVMTTEEALESANKVGYPVLMRPSYVLGGQNMIIALNDQDIIEYMKIILATNIENPVLIDKYLMGTEIEVDAICDGTDILIPGIMEHIERAGVHSGDSIAVYPAWNLTDDMTQKIIDHTKNLALSLNTIGLINIQYLIYEGELYVIEVNPRSSRTIPYISKVTGIPMVDIATRAMLGEKIADMGYGTGLYPNSPYVAVKVPVFSFEKLINVDNQLGPEMKSTGEVLGIANNLDEALYKGLLSAGYKMKHDGGIFISVRDVDKGEIGDIAKKFHKLGFKLYATSGTAEVFKKYGLECEIVPKINESDYNPLTLMESGAVNYVISTSSKGRIPTRDSVRIRRKSIERNIPCLTSLDTANALADSMHSRYSVHSLELVNINKMRKEKSKLDFTKMQSNGNDYLFFDVTKQKIDNPEGIAVRLSDRRFGIGAEGIVLIDKSDIADAKMRIFNRDGSEGEMSGNSIRGLGKYLYDNGIVNKTDISIETLSGVKELKMTTKNGKIDTVKVNMGKPSLNPASIPVKLDGDRVIDREVEIDGAKYNISCVSMGNPHCVIFADDVESIDLRKVGPKFENHEIFPERVNTEFAKVINKNTIIMRCWERGSGLTMECGTGAAAVTVAAVELGLCSKNEQIKIKLHKGEITTCYSDDGNVYLIGDAQKVFDGSIVL
ncbi:MAG: carbamoyl-phosphate synthase large subunit, partial [Clostridia bacterium]|nr:carbamoyl-phosphate synthase large subunit [Clostridia bacterium]